MELDEIEGTLIEKLADLRGQLFPFFQNDNPRFENRFPGQVTDKSGVYPARRFSQSSSACP